MFEVVALTLGLSAANAATVSEIPNFTLGLPTIELNAADFARVGECGSGQSVGAGGCFAHDVNDLQVKFGRNFGEIDSQDANQLWTINFTQPRRAVEFSVSDMMDMSWSEAFRITVDDATWETTARRGNGTLSYFRVTFDKVVRSTSILLEHVGLQPGTNQSGDGFGVNVCRKR